MNEKHICKRRPLKRNKETGQIDFTPCGAEATWEVTWTATVEGEEPFTATTYICGRHMRADRAIVKQGGYRNNVTLVIHSAKRL